jgi:hypothetical protein
MTIRFCHNYHASRRSHSAKIQLEEKSDEDVCVLDLGFRERGSRPPQHPEKISGWLAGWLAMRGDKGDEMGDFRASTLAQDS